MAVEKRLVELSNNLTAFDASGSLTLDYLSSDQVATSLRNLIHVFSCSS